MCWEVGEYATDSPISLLTVPRFAERGNGKPADNPGFDKGVVE